jgi:hypothetical protein
MDTLTLYCIFSWLVFIGAFIGDREGFSWIEIIFIVLFAPVLLPVVIGYNATSK